RENSEQHRARHQHPREDGPSQTDVGQIHGWPPSAWPWCPSCPSCSACSACSAVSGLVSVGATFSDGDFSPGSSADACVGAFGGGAAPPGDEVFTSDEPPSSSASMEVCSVIFTGAPSLSGSTPRTTNIEPAVSPRVTSTSPLDVCMPNWTVFALATLLSTM